MKKLSSLLLVSILGGAITLGSYKLFIEENNHSPILATEQTNQKQAATFIANKYATGTANSSINTDFTEAADKTVHAVVHAAVHTVEQQQPGVADDRSRLAHHRHAHLRGQSLAVIS